MMGHSSGGDGFADRTHSQLRFGEKAVTIGVLEVEDRVERPVEVVGEPAVSASSWSRDGPLIPPGHRPRSRSGPPRTRARNWGRSRPRPSLRCCSSARRGVAGDRNPPRKRPSTSSGVISVISPTCHRPRDEQDAEVRLVLTNFGVSEWLDLVARRSEPHPAFAVHGSVLVNVTHRKREWNFSSHRRPPGLRTASLFGSLGLLEPENNRFRQHGRSTGLALPWVIALDECIGKVPDHHWGAALVACSECYLLGISLPGPSEQGPMPNRVAPLLSVTPRVSVTSPNAIIELVSIFPPLPWT